VPTGWTTAEATIMQAMSELPATGGSIVLLDGTCWVDNAIVMFLSNVTLSGQGSSTIVKLKPGVAENIIQDQSAVTGITISKLVIDCNNTTYLIRGILFYYAVAPTINDVTVQNCTNYQGIYTASSNTTITNCTAQNNGADGIVVGANNCIITNNIVQNNGIGILVYAGNNTISNNQVNNNQLDGISLDAYAASHNTVSGNNCTGNGTQTNDTYSNIVVYNGSYNNIQGNTCRKGTGSNLPAYGIQINNANCTSNLINNNDCYTGGATAGIANSGTTTNFGAGNRVNSGAWSLVPS
jgi:parallel beta-helix repeat protein